VLDAVMLVLREVLEAALFVSLLLALGSQLQLGARWARVAIPLGLAASWALSRFATPIAESFDGTGQELMNAALYALAILSFIALTTLLVPALRAAGEVPRLDPRPFFVFFVLIVAGSMAREGSEIWIYLSGFEDAPAALGSALVGGLIGTGIGLSLCALVYYLFALLSRRVFLAVFFVLAALVVGGLSMQLAKQGLQSGLLDSSRPVWDTSALVSERSGFGQLLHALFGYDANPDATQLLFYFGALFAMAAGAGFRLMRRGARHG
jgi:high-affinity iron transporter